MIPKSTSSIVVLAAVLVWFCSPPVFSQSPKTSSAEKQSSGDLNPTGAGAPAETALGRPSADEQMESPASLEADLCMSPEKVIGLLARPGRVFLVDVRRPEAFKALWIPGSINVPAYAVGTKTMLKGRPVVLIDEGWRYRQLADLCIRLRKDGFDARVLLGGMMLWHARGGLLQGDPFARRRLKRVPPEACHADRGGLDWLIVDISENSVKEMHALFPHARRVALDRTSPDLAARLESLARAHVSEPLGFVLVVDENGQGETAVEKALEGAGIQKAFFLEGGMPGYREFMKRQDAIRQHVKGEEIGVKKCRRCP